MHARFVASITDELRELPHRERLLIKIEIRIHCLLSDANLGENKQQ